MYVKIYDEKRAYKYEPRKNRLDAIAAYKQFDGNISRSVSTRHPSIKTALAVVAIICGIGIAGVIGRLFEP